MPASPCKADLVKCVAKYHKFLVAHFSINIYSVPNSTEIARDKHGKISKYTTFGPDGKIVKEVRLKGKDHGNILRSNVKEPKYNLHPKTGQKFQNGYQVRPPNQSEIPKKIKVCLYVKRER